MATFSYKCPNCSASLTYRPQLKKMKCDFCLSEFTAEEIDNYIKNNPDRVISDFNEEAVQDTILKDESWNHGKKIDQIHGYNCQNCGAEVVTTDTTITSFCYYCHSPVVLVDKTQGAFRPNLLIPFKIEKEKAENLFLQWAKKKRYVRKDFYSNSQLEKLTGMYLPYWALNAEFEINLDATAYKRRIYSSGNREYTETQEYKIERAGKYEINNLTELAYSKIDKRLLHSITPFDFGDLEDFRIFYLNGFFSESYDVSYNQVELELKNQAQNYTNKYIKDQLAPYHDYKLNKKEIKAIDYKGSYLLLPTWLLTYDYQNKKYIYALNGQTGKAYGELPIDKKLIARDAAIAGLVIFILMLLGGWFIW